MKRLSGLLAMLFLSLMAFAQDAPKVEIFGGYQLYNLDTFGFVDRVNFNGFDVDVAGKLKSWLALVGDVGGTYKNGDNIYTFMGGARFSGPWRVSPFAEIMIGGTRFAGVGSLTKLSVAEGGGLDINVSQRIALRPLKIDYIWVGDSEANLNNYRFSSGIVFKF